MSGLFDGVVLYMKNDSFLYFCIHFCILYKNESSLLYGNSAQLDDSHL